VYLLISGYNLLYNNQFFLNDIKDRFDISIGNLRVRLCKNIRSIKKLSKNKNIRKKMKKRRIKENKRKDEIRNRQNF
jgi:hypothetical protein